VTTVSGLPIIHALIPAAGRSVRFGGTTLKQYAHLAGLPVIAHSIEAVSRHPSVRSVTVALAPDDGIFGELVQPDWPRIHTVDGGDSRAQTVLNGLQAIATREEDWGWVLVHDAARPCLSWADLDLLIEQGTKHSSGAILAVPVNDTVKQSGADGRIDGTVDRSGLWAAQTPQLFRLADLTVRLEAALAAGQSPTDEAAAMEAAGVRPLLVKGCSTNIKITGAGDLALAEFILQQQAVKEGH
jgi:2-C-methyl-D-erythritol 4-phosphate cytidylyltransferase